MSERRYIQTFLSMTLESPCTATSNNIPDTDVAIIARRSGRTDSSRNVTNGIFVTFEVKIVVRIVINVRLQGTLQKRKG